MTDASTLSRDLRAFRSIVEAHLASTGVRQTAFSKAATGSPDFVRKLRAGEDMRVSTVLRVLDYMAMQDLC